MMKKFILFLCRIAGTILFADKHVENMRRKKQQDQQHFTFCDYSKTIRLMPQNYMVAFATYNDHGHFIADPDAAINDKLATKVFLMLRGLRFEKNTSNVVQSLNTLLKH